MDWAKLRLLWHQIQNGNTPGWAQGKALEHLIVRAFQLSGLAVEYPYDVPPGGRPIEQIDGIVYLNELVFLIECKDKDREDVAAISKMQHQLARRPPTTLGCIFVAGVFTEPALLVADMTPPHRITLWSGVDIEAGLEKADFRESLVEKYRNLCRFGMTDYSPHYRELKVT